MPKLLSLLLLLGLGCATGSAQGTITFSPDGAVLGSKASSLALDLSWKASNDATHPLGLSNFSRYNLDDLLFPNELIDNPSLYAGAFGGICLCLLIQSRRVKNRELGLKHPKLRKKEAVPTVETV